MNRTDKSTSVGLTLSAYIALYLITSFALSAFSGAVYNVISLFFKVIRFGLPVLIYHKLTGYVPNTKSRISLNGRGVIEFVFAFSFTAIAVNVVGLLTEKMLSLFGLKMSQNAFSGDVGAFIFMFLSSVLLAAVAEEMLFRGVVMDALEGFSLKVRVLLSAILFSLMHCSFLQMPYAFAAGVVISLFFVRTGSLIYAAALHFASNLLTYVFALLRVVADEKTVNAVTNVVFLILVLLAVTGTIYFILRARNNEKTVRESQLKLKNFFTSGTVIYIVFTMLIALINIF